MEAICYAIRGLILYCKHTTLLAVVLACIYEKLTIKKTRFNKEFKSSIFLHKTGEENELEQSRF